MVKNSDRLDIVILHSNEETNTLNSCIETLPKNNVDISIRRTIRGDLGKDRLLALLQGSNKFVSFADPDDIYFPEVFFSCIDLLKRFRQAPFVHTKEISNGYFTSKKYRGVAFYHGIIVFRRSSLVEGLTEENIVDICNIKRSFDIQTICTILAKKNNPVYLDDVGRIWLRHSNNTHKTCTLEDYEIYKKYSGVK